MPKITDEFTVCVEALNLEEQLEIVCVWEAFLDRTGWCAEDLEKARAVFVKLIEAQRVYVCP